MFWFKRKEVTLDFFTCNERLFNAHIPKKAAAYLPAWWKSLSPSYESPSKISPKSIPRSTMKFCAGFKDLYANGFIIPMWSDLIFDVSKDGYFYYFADGTSTSQEHPSQQNGNNFSQFHHAKLMSPWVAVERFGIMFAFIEPTWSWLKVCEDFRVLPGTVSYDLQSSTNINLFLAKREKEYRVQIDAGEPMVHLIPLTDKKVNIKTHLISQIEFNAIYNKNPPTKFIGDFEIYKKFMRNQKI